MIRGLRSRHRWTFVVQGLVLPIGLGLALGSRASVPANSNSPQSGAANAAPSEPPAREVQLKTGLVELRLRLWNALADGTRVLELTPVHDLELPDVLVYWAESDATDELPKNGVLLGSLAGTQARRFVLTKLVHGGRLYLYSLAHQELVTSVELEP